MKLKLKKKTIILGGIWGLISPLFYFMLYLMGHIENEIIAFLMVLITIPASIIFILINLTGNYFSGFVLWLIVFIGGILNSVFIIYSIDKIYLKWKVYREKWKIGAILGIGVYLPYLFFTLFGYGGTFSTFDILINFLFYTIYPKEIISSFNLFPAIIIGVFQWSVIGMMIGYLIDKYKSKE